MAALYFLRRIGYEKKTGIDAEMTLLAGSLDSGMLVSAADFSAEESVEQAVEEEFFPAVHSFLPSTFWIMGWW